MPERLFDIEHLDADRLRRTADRLRTLGYTEDGVRERLGLDDISEISLDQYPYYINERLRRRDRLDVAILLLLLQGVVAVEELNALFDKDERLLLKNAGILLAEKSTRTYRAAASIYPLRDRLFVCDHRFQHMAWIRSRAPRDPVMHLTPETYHLARATIRKRARSILDIGTGAGVHAILGAAHADRCVGVDSNPRAVNFARLNAVLNDAWNAVFHEGDLFRPLGGERFDLILAHPPYVPSPVYELRWRDGGPSGADVLRRVIAAIPDYLQAGGLAQVVTHLGEREGESYLERVRRWLSGANMNLHALRMGEQSVEEYAVSQARPPFGDDYARYATALKTWIDNLKAQRFTRLVSLVISFEWNEEGTNPPWSREDEAKAPRRAIGQELARVLQAKKRSRQPNALRALDRCRVGVPDDLLLVERRRPTGTGFETKDFRVTWKDPVLAPELEIKPLVRDLLERVDNRATVPEIIARYARDTKISVEEVDERCRRAFLAMLERGLVTLDEVESAAPRVEGTRRAADDDLISAPQTRPVLPELAPSGPAPRRPQTKIYSNAALPAADQRLADQRVAAGRDAPHGGAGAGGRDADQRLAEQRLLEISDNQVEEPDPDDEAKLAEVDGALAELAGLVPPKPKPRVGDGSGPYSGENPKARPLPGAFSGDEIPAAGTIPPRRNDDPDSPVQVPDADEE